MRYRAACVARSAPISAANRRFDWAAAFIMSTTQHSAAEAGGAVWPDERRANSDRYTISRCYGSYAVVGLAPRGDATSRASSGAALTTLDDRLKSRDLTYGDRVCHVQRSALGIRVLVILAETAFSQIQPLHAPFRGLFCGDL